MGYLDQILHTYLFKYCPVTGYKMHCREKLFRQSLVTVRMPFLAKRSHRYAYICLYNANLRNLFQNSYLSTLIDMLKYSVWLPEICFQFDYLEFILISKQTTRFVHITVSIFIFIIARPLFPPKCTRFCVYSKFYESNVIFIECYF